jgi:hypothetical protein
LSAGLVTLEEKRGRRSQVIPMSIGMATHRI